MVSKTEKQKKGKGQKAIVDRRPGGEKEEDHPMQPPQLEAPAPETQEQLTARLQSCSHELKAVLDQHRCDLRAGFKEPESVGADGSKIQFEAVWQIVALRVEADG